jgi:hypothetical protein
MQQMRLHCTRKRGTPNGWVLSRRCELSQSPSHWPTFREQCVERHCAATTLGHHQQRRRHVNIERGPVENTQRHHVVSVKHAGCRCNTLRAPVTVRWCNLNLNTPITEPAGVLRPRHVNGTPLYDNARKISMPWSRVRTLAPGNVLSTRARSPPR